MTGLSCNAERGVTGILHAGLINADHSDQGLGRSRPGDLPLECAGVGDIVRDLFVAGTAISGKLNLHISGDALGAPLDSLSAADRPHFTAIGPDDRD